MQGCINKHISKSLNEYRFQLEGLLDIVRNTRAGSHTAEKPDKFSLEKSSSGQLERCARRYDPWLSQACQKQMYTSTAFPGKKIRKSEPFDSEYLIVNNLFQYKRHLA